jgi:hypothetical protein
VFVPFKNRTWPGNGPRRVEFSREFKLPGTPKSRDDTEVKGLIDLGFQPLRLKKSKCETEVLELTIRIFAGTQLNVSVQPTDRVVMAAKDLDSGK